MSKMKRLTGFVLVVVMIISMLPTAALAEETVHTGFEFRLHAATTGKTYADVESTIHTASDAEAKKYETNYGMNVTYKWYSMYYTDYDVPAEEKANYTPYTYNDGIDTKVYVKPMTAEEIFTLDRMYLCEATVTTPNGEKLADNCVVVPADAMIQEQTSNKIVLAIEVTPRETDINVSSIAFSCNTQGVVNAPELTDDYIYVYKNTDGSYDPLVYDNPVDRPIGTASINKAEFKELTGAIDLTNAPQIQLIKVSKVDWGQNNSVVIYGYGLYTIRMSKPYLTVDTMQFGSAITVTEVGSTITGKYGYDIAHGSFDGWFIDADATTPAREEGESYAVFTLNSTALFDPNLKAEDVSLRYGSDSYVGAKLLKTAGQTSIRIAFLIPSDRISVSMDVVGDGGSANFGGYDTPSISMKPLNDGTYPGVSINVTAQPGYYVKSIKINGENWNSADNPIYESRPGTKFISIPNNEPLSLTGIYYPVGNTIVTVEFAKADIIKIEFGNAIQAYTGEFADETKWHSNATYYAPEGYGTQLCLSGALRIDEPQMALYTLNTKPDGTGHAAVLRNGRFMWASGHPYENGESDNITLYAMFKCMAHIEYGAEDNAWQYVGAKAPTCTSKGNIAYRHCPHCGIYQVADEYGNYYDVAATEVVLEVTDHNHNQYTDNGDGTHNVKCDSCSDTKKENHQFTEGVCPCGARDYIKGDMNEDGIVSDADAIYLLYYTLFPEDYPIKQPADLNGDGVISDADAVYLLYYTLFPEDYPLK